MGLFTGRRSTLDSLLQMASACHPALPESRADPILPAFPPQEPARYTDAFLPVEEIH